MAPHWVVNGLLFLAGAVQAWDGLPVDALRVKFDRGDTQDFHLAEWSKKEGYRLAIADPKKEGEQKSLQISCPPEISGFNRSGKAVRRLEAKPFQGKRVRWSANLRIEAKPFNANSVALWLAAVRPEFRPGHWDEMGGRGLRSAVWQRAEVVIDVAQDAEFLEIGLILNGFGGVGNMKDGRLEILGRAGEGNELPRAITRRGLENVVALTRLMGYVRYFHPSDEAARTDWDRWLINAIAHVEPAKDSADLAMRLREAIAFCGAGVDMFEVGQLRPKAGLEPPPVKSRIVTWRHLNVGTNATLGHFRSERVVDRALEGFPQRVISPEKQSEPPAILEVDLGGGVQARIPLALYEDEQGTLPRCQGKPLPNAHPKDLPLTGDDRATRLAAVAVGWAKMQHFFPYFDVVKCDWDAALRTALGQAAVDRDAAEFHKTLEVLWANLQDSHTVVRGGSGTLLVNGSLPISWDLIEGELAVTWVRPDVKGIRVGDVVTELNGKTALEMLAERTRRIAGATATFRRLRGCQELRNGPAGQVVTLLVRDPKGKTAKVSLAREAADPSPLRGPSMREPRYPVVQEIKPGRWYIDLDRFTFSALEKAKADLSKAEGIVFDLRGYPSLESMGILPRLGTRDQFSDRLRDVITRFPDRKNLRLDIFGKDTWPTQPTQPIKCPLVFITDGRAVSAAESVLAIVKNTKLGPIVGEASAGSNGGVNLHVLPGGFRVSWTGQVFRKRDESVFHGLGILPDHPARPTLAALAMDRDLPWEQAVDILEKAIAKKVSPNNP